MFNDICFNGESWFTTFSTAFDLAFGVQEVMQHVLALGFHSASWWQDQRRRVKDGMQPSINTLAGFSRMTSPLLALQSFHKEQSGLFEKDCLSAFWQPLRCAICPWRRAGEETQMHAHRAPGAAAGPACSWANRGGAFPSPSWCRIQWVMSLLCPSAYHSMGIRTAPSLQTPWEASRITMIWLTLNLEHGQVQVSEWWSLIFPSLADFGQSFFNIPML